MKRLRLFVATLVAWLGFPLVFVKAQQLSSEQADARVIDNLRSNGADLSKLHNIDFYFYFDHQADAAAAAQAARNLGYSVIDIRMSLENGRWSMHIMRMMAPELPAIVAVNRSLEALAAAHNGVYDGWGTAVVK